MTADVDMEYNRALPSPGDRLDRRSTDTLLDAGEGILADLARPALTVPASMPALELDGLFHRDPGLRNVVVPSAQGYLLVDRGWYAMHMAGRLGYGRGLAVRRRVSELGIPLALVMPGSTTVTAAGAAVLARPEDVRHDDVVVLMDDAGEGPRIGHVPTSDLFERLARRYAHQSLHDPLTGLPNRLAFLQSVEKATADDADVVLLYIDLDRFKDVNDAHGHAAGDQVLMAFGQRLRDIARDGDLVARLGGDEFAVLAAGPMSALQSRAFGERVVLDASAPFTLLVIGPDGRLEERSADLGASVGIAHADGQAGDVISAPELLLKKADLAMYRAKARGRGRAEIDGHSSGGRVLRGGQHADMEQRLRLAIEADEIVLHMQPVVELPSGRVVGVEALARWNDPETGWVSPTTFIPLAERTGLIVELGRRLLESACSMAAGWRALGQDVMVGVNVSPVQLEERSFVDVVADVLARHGLPGNALCIEVTESAVLRDVRLASDRLQRLRELGVRVALDDFGTGSSSLTLLRKLPVDFLKIDKSFVDGVLRDPRDAVLVRMIVDAAHVLGLMVCAEGVEDAAQARQLVAMGVDTAQGWHFAHARPLVAGALETLQTRAVDTSAPVALPLGADGVVAVIVGIDGRVDYVSPSVAEALGRSPGEIAGVAAVRFVHPDDVPAIRATLTSGVGAAARVRHRDGGWRHWVVRGTALNDRVLWVCHDVTAAREIENSLRNSESRFRLAFEESPVAMALSRLDGTFVQVNRAFAALLGTSMDDLVGSTVAAHTHPDDRDTDDVNIGQLERREVSSHLVDKRVVRRDGVVLRVRVHASVVVDAEGVPVWVVAHILPI